MTSAGRFKHLWIQKVLEDQRLSLSAMRVLVYCADKYVLSGGFAFSIRQETVAANLGLRKRQTVGDAFRRGRDLGWLEKYERRRGRGWHGGDAYILTFPAGIGPSVQTSFGEDDKIGLGPQISSEEIGPSPRPSSGEEYVRGRVTISPWPRHNKSAATVEIRPRVIRQDPQPPAETTDLNGVDEWFSTNDASAHGVARSEDSSELDQLFGGLFGTQTRRDRATIPAADIVDVEAEPKSAILSGGGALMAETTAIVDFAAHRDGELARLRAMYPDADWAAP